MKISKLVFIQFTLFLSFLMFTTMPSKAEAALEAQRIVVALSGGDYTSISNALSSISPDENNPYVIDIMPGTYTESSRIEMKSYVHLRGAGATVTTLQASIRINDKTNVTISGLTVMPSSMGIFIYESSPVIKDNIIKDNDWGYGISIVFSSPTIIRNTIEGNNTGIYSHGASAEISGNVIKNNAAGIEEYNGSSSIIKDNVIEGHTGSGIGMTQNSSSSISHNKITNSGNYDIFVDSSCTPNISFNIYDTIDNYGGVGPFLYNVKSDGTSQP